MSYWNYRVIAREHPEGTTTYQVHEVYYDAVGDIVSWTEDGIIPFGETYPELVDDMDLFREAFRQPILIEQDLVDHLTALDS